MPDTYVRFQKMDRSPKRKTDAWLVFSIHDDVLGTVRFFGRWRCYTFWPEALTIFNHGCLTDIAAFCFQRTEDWRKELAKR